MAYGSMRQMYAYAQKVFDRNERLSQISDTRTNPTVPLSGLLLTWQWGLVRRTPSTEQIGDLLADPRWRARLGLKPEDGGSPDSAARILEGVSADDWNAMLLEDFFIARRAGLLSDEGQYGLRCAALDMNELFKSENVHCDLCQVREKTVLGANGQRQTVKEYYHQAVALSWISGDIPFPIGWEILQPGEGELTAALRLLERLLPLLRRSVDLIIGDALYCCRPFFETVCGAGLQAMAISSAQTEMDQEMDLWIQTDPPRLVSTADGDVAVWELESEAWQADLKRKLRVIHCERRYESPAWKHERRQLRVVTSTPLEILPAGQGWKVGRTRWTIENGTFNRFTRDYALQHNYHHSVPAILGLLAMRSFACMLTLAYHQYATARSKNAPSRFLKWFQDIVMDDWVRFLDQVLAPPAQSSG